MSMRLLPAVCRLRVVFGAESERIDIGDLRLVVDDQDPRLGTRLVHIGP